MPSRQYSQLAILSALALICSAGAGCQNAAPKPPPPKPPEVVFAYPVQETVTNSEEYTGRLAAVKMVDLRARVSGYLEEVNFQDGTDIQAGDELFRIDDRPFVAALDEAEASVAQLEARLERQRRQEQRAIQLVEQKVANAEDLEAAQFARIETDAQLKAARAAADVARLNLEFTRVKSPIAGRISRRLVDPGNLVRADDTMLATIVTVDPLYAYFDVDERTVLQIRRLIAEGKMQSAQQQATPVSLSLADDDSFAISGMVNFVDNQLSATTGTLRLRADVQNPRKLLAPGMFVRVKVPIGAAHPAILVQEQALGSDQGQRFVYVINGEDKVEYRRVVVGQLKDNRRIIEKGLEATDRVIVTGLQRVRPKMTVVPKPLEVVAESKPAATPVEVTTAEVLTTPSDRPVPSPAQPSGEQKVDDVALQDASDKEPANKDID